jgi:hypothetical protein
VTCLTLIKIKWEIKEKVVLLDAIKASRNPEVTPWFSSPVPVTVLTELS